MRNLSDRSSHFTDSVIRRMTRIAIEHNAINLSQGFPDFDPPKALIERLKEVSDEDFHQYSITCGALNLRKAEMTVDCYGHYLVSPVFTFPAPSGSG